MVARIALEELAVSPKIFGVLIGIVGAIVLAYGIWYHRVHPREVIRQGSVAIETKGKGGPVKTSARTRTVRVGAVILNEVELPGGTWVDCAGDCATAYREATTDFWDTQSRNGR